MTIWIGRCHLGQAWLSRGEDVTRLLEPFAMVWIDQAMNRGRGRDFAFALVEIKTTAPEIEN